MNTPVAAAFRCFLTFLISAAAYADSAQWNLNPTSGDWNTADNWTPMSVPDGPADIATFTFSNSTLVSISEDTQVSGITFTSAATNPYSITVGDGLTLTLSGTGIANNSGITQFLYCDGFGGEGGQILFANSASASDASITSYGSMQFSNNSSAGSADIENGGDILFSNGATSSSANILNFSLGVTEFSDSSTAGDANVNGYDASFIVFSDSSTAGSATIQTLGIVSLSDFCEASKARIWIHELSPSVPMSGILEIGQHNAPGVTIGSLEGDGRVYLGANTLTVGSNNLDTTFSGVIVDGTFATSLTNIGTRAFDCATPSSYNASPRLERGALNMYDSSSGNTLAIQDRALSGSTGGSLTKIGKGILFLSGANTYTGNSNVEGGVLQVDGSITSDTFVNRGGTLTGSGTVNGNVTNHGGNIGPGDASGVPGVLTVGGNYTTLTRQIAGGTLYIQIGAAKGQVSVLDVQGHANLGGFLDPVLVNGFVPEIGQSFMFLNYASFNGFFRVRKPVFDHGRKRWLLTYNPTSAVLTAVENQRP